VDDYESVGSCSDFANMSSPTGGYGVSEASVTTSLSVNRQTGLPTAILPDVVNLNHDDPSQCGSTMTVKYKDIKQDTPILSSAAGHSSR